jgi:hypothetical protein
MAGASKDRPPEKGARALDYVKTQQKLDGAKERRAGEAKVEDAAKPGGRSDKPGGRPKPSGDDPKRHGDKLAKAREAAAGKAK